MKRTRLKPVSDKRRARLNLRRQTRNHVLQRDQYVCQARHAPGDCAGVLDVHEKIRRSQWAAGIYDVDNCVTVCRRHHEWITGNPQAAHDLGLVLWSWER